MQVIQNPNSHFYMPNFPSVEKVLAVGVQDVLSIYIYKQTSVYYSHEYEKDLLSNSTGCMWCCFECVS